VPSTLIAVNSDRHHRRSRWRSWRRAARADVAAALLPAGGGAAAGRGAAGDAAVGDTARAWRQASRFGEEVYALSHDPAHYQAQTGRVGPPPTQAEIKAKLAAKAKAESKAAPPTPTPTPPPPLPPPPPPRGAIVASGQGGRRGGRPPSRCDVQKATAFRAKYWAMSSVTFLNPDERLAHPQLEHRAHYRRRCR